MPHNFTLGALDLCKLYHGQSHRDAIWESIELAPRLEEMGYTRYWLAEHHGSDVAHGSPELLVPILAGVTKKMRIGTAGVLLRLYSPYKVAEGFRLLHTVFPRRIDMGIARGYVAPDIQEVMCGAAGGQTFEEKVSDLMHFMRGTGPCVANPARTVPPETWMLGSRHSSMKLAAQHGTAFSLALHLDLGDGPPAREIIDEYRSTFRPSAELKSPKWSIALAGICAATVDEARSMLPAGAIGVKPNVVGTPTMWRQELERLHDETGTTEFAIMDLCGGVDRRSRSYELIAGSVQ